MQRVSTACLKPAAVEYGFKRPSGALESLRVVLVDEPAGPSLFDRGLDELRRDMAPAESINVRRTFVTGTAPISMRSLRGTSS